MSTPHDPGREDPERDYDAEFTRILETEGLPSDREDAEAAEDTEEAEAAEDFEPPDPDLPPASDAMVWSWTALIGGVVLTLLAAVLDSIPTWLGALGGAAAVGGLISLLAHIPKDRSDPTDGAQV